MNVNLVTIVKQIIAGYGEAALADPQQFKAFFSDLARDEPKPLRIAFDRCIEEGAYNALKTAPDAGERAERKAAIARRVCDEHGLDMALCGEALDILEAALFADKKEPARCVNCGGELQEGWVSCPYCGAAQTAPPQQPQYVPPQFQQQQYTPPQPDVIPAAENTVPVEAGTKKKPLAIALIAVAVFAVAVTAVWYFFQRSAPQAAPANMVRINGGTFTMGSPASEPERNVAEIQHSVSINPFYMGRYEVTQREWLEIMGNNPSHFKGDNLPVENVSWYDAVEYCNRLSEWERLTPAYTINGTDVTWNKNAKGYRLPTEAEWEYACRAGTITAFSTGMNITTNQANYDGNSPYNGNAGGMYRGKTIPVGSFMPNSWGLYDMHGNVWEWCWDWYGEYSRGVQTDPAGPASGSRRVFRGGSWYYVGGYLRSAYRIDGDPSSRYVSLGFRLVRNAK